MAVERKNPRLIEYDYSEPGYYFVTISGKEINKDVFCNISSTVPVRAAHLGGPSPDDEASLDDILSICSIHLTPAGAAVRDVIEGIGSAYPNVHVDSYVIMPDHIHMIIVIESPEIGPPRCAARTITLSGIINAMKSLCTRKIGYPVWHRSFYDRVIRTHMELNNIRQYIEYNPARWLLNQHKGNDTHAQEKT